MRLRHLRLRLLRIRLLSLARRLVLIQPQQTPLLRRRYAHEDAACFMNPSLLAFSKCRQDSLPCAALQATSGISTKSVLNAVRLIKEPVVLAALWATTLHLDLIQGTSINENWHSWLKTHLPILGGIRTYFLLLILLQWQQMRFNKAVRDKRAGKARPGDDGNGGASGQLNVRREEALRQQIAKAFTAANPAQDIRKAYHQYMAKSYDLDSMSAMGFTKAKPKASSGGTWSEAEIAGMLECLGDLNSGKTSVHTQDPCYFLAHHGLMRQKNASQVRALLRHLEKRYES